MSSDPYFAFFFLGGGGGGMESKSANFHNIIVLLDSAIE